MSAILSSLVTAGTGRVKQEEQVAHDMLQRLPGFVVAKLLPGPLEIDPLRGGDPFLVSLGIPVEHILAVTDGVGALRGRTAARPPPAGGGKLGRTNN